MNRRGFFGALTTFAVAPLLARAAASPVEKPAPTPKKIDWEDGETTYIDGGSICTTTVRAGKLTLDATKIRAGVVSIC